MGNELEGVEFLGTRYLHRGSLMADGLLSMRWGVFNIEG
jgi:hypothetical protein